MQPRHDRNPRTGAPSTKRMHTHRPATERMGKPTTDRTKRMVPVPRKDNTLVLIGGIGGGVLLLIIIIAAAASGPKKEKPVVKQNVEVAAPVEAPRKLEDCGAIMFICANSPQHPDEEMKIGVCTCGARARFYVDKDSSGYRCLKCSKIYDNAAIKCPKCGKAPRVTKLKHIPN